MLVIVVVVVVCMWVERELGVVPATREGVKP